MRETEAVSRFVAGFGQAGSLGVLVVGWVLGLCGVFVLRVACFWCAGGCWAVRAVWAAVSVNPLACARRGSSLNLVPVLPVVPRWSVKGDSVPDSDAACLLVGLAAFGTH